MANQPATLRSPSPARSSAAPYLQGALRLDAVLTGTLAGGFTYPAVSVMFAAPPASVSLSLPSQPPVAFQDPFLVLTQDAGGVDIDCWPDLSPGFALVPANSARAQRIMRNLSTPKGSYWRYPNRCIDLRDYLNDGITQADLARIQSAVQNECLQDEEIQSATVAISLDAPSRTMTISVRCATNDGPFTLTAKVTALTVDLLSVKQN